MGNEVIAFVKILLWNQSAEGATWEVEDDMIIMYPHNFYSPPILAQDIIPHDLFLQICVLVILMFFHMHAWLHLK